MLIPALDLINGNVVRLQQGDFKRRTTYASSPWDILSAYENSGAAWLHVVDLDGARNPQQRQFKLLQQLTQATQMQLQVGGGIRTTADIERLFSAGVQRVVVGSVAVIQPQLVQHWLQQYGGDALVIAIDVQLDSQGIPRAATHGWHHTSARTLNEVVELLLPAGLRHMLCTDIQRDGMLTGPNVGLYQSLKQQYPQLQLQASGGVSQLSDLAALRAIQCDSVILGKALLNGTFTLKEALACWPNVSSPA